MEVLWLYRLLIGARLRAQMEYKISFFLDAVATCVGVVVEFFGILVLFLHMDALGGWTLAEVTFLYGTAELALALGQLFVEGFDRLPETIRRGEFDRVLLRPRSAFFQVLASEFPLRRLGRLVQALAVLGLALAWLGVDWSPGHWAFLAWSVLGGTLFFAGLFVAGATFSFWTVEGLEAMNILTYGGVTLASYPMNIFAEWMRNFFVFVVPLAFVNFYPALWLLNKPDPFGLPAFLPFLAVPLCALVFAGALGFWRVGVRHYQGTGS